MQNKYDGIVFDLGQVLIKCFDEEFKDVIDQNIEKIHQWEISVVDQSDIDLEEYNQLLGQWNVSNIHFMRMLRTQGYKVYCFSNTSYPHYVSFSRAYVNMFGREMKRDFDEEFYSFRMGMRKPAKAAFEHVREKVGDRILYIDDRKPNVGGAPKEWTSIHLTNIENLIKEVKARL